MAHIHSRYDEFTAHGWCITNPNTMIVVMALLWGGRDFGKTLCLAVQPGFVPMGVRAEACCIPCTETFKRRFS